MSEEIKFCVNCKHCMVGKSAEFARCMKAVAEDRYGVYLVTGVMPEDLYQYCTIMRRFNDKDSCGIEAKYYEPRI